MADERACFYTIIYILSVLSIAWPLYGYFLFKWYQNRHHFVITNRWPHLSLTIISMAIISQTLNVIQASLCIEILSTISMGLTNLGSGIVYYRAHLLYTRFLRSRQRLNEIHGPSKTRTMNITKFETKLGNKIWSKTILILSVTTSILIITARFLSIPYMVAMSFSTCMVMGIITLINLCRKKVTDSIGVTKECMLQISCQLAMLCGGPFVGSLVPKYIDINLWNGFFVVTLFCFFPLFMAYKSIQSVSKRRRSSLSSSDDENIPRSSAKLSVENYSESGVAFDGLKVTNHHDIAPSNSTNMCRLQLRNISSDKLRKGLDVFLKGNIGNFALFANYLTECFCLENLLFLERAIILFHAINERNKNDKNNEQNNEKFKCRCYGLKFLFLHQIQADVDKMIEDAQNDKIGILNVMRMIFDQFICSSSDTEINVSYGVRSALQALFEQSDDEILSQLKSFDDMLAVYHWAIREAWNMCVSVYGFQFKSYVRKNRKKHHMESELSLSLVHHDNVKQTALPLPKISENQCSETSVSDNM